MAQKIGREKRSIFWGSKKIGRKKKGKQNCGWCFGGSKKWSEKNGRKFEAAK